MIKLLDKGRYQVVMTRDRHLMLYLHDKGYHWHHARGIGDMLIFSKKPHKIHFLLGEGEFRLYKVKNEPFYVDLEHLELGMGPNTHQGFLLLTGLPTEQRLRKRIVPTKEVIAYVETVLA